MYCNRVTKGGLYGIGIQVLTIEQFAVLLEKLVRESVTVYVDKSDLAKIPARTVRTCRSDIQCPDGKTEAEEHACTCRFT